MPFPLTPSNYDEVVSALTGNGELCTTLSPTGYHVAPDCRTDMAHATQFFVMAGRRRGGPDHPLINYGTISRSLSVDGESRAPKGWRQEIDWASGAVVTEWEYAGLEERTRSFVSLADNAFLADTVLANSGEIAFDIEFRLTYRFGEPEADLKMTERDGGAALDWRVEDQTGEIRFGAALPLDLGKLAHERFPDGAAATLSVRLEPGEAAAITVLLHFSDRINFEFPLTVVDADLVAERHEKAWAEFWSQSEVVTGVAAVDAFRISSLYTIRCQATPWSIPPTLSHPYWDGGAFHDEMYPFFGLLSSNYPGLAERIPYFRLTTLPQAQERARSRGALYPWSSTEQGEERDPNGPWLTERFHLGQFAVCIHALWLYERNPLQHEDLYPVLRELARYFEMNVLERETGGQWSVFSGQESAVGGRLRTRACVDFDESAGQVTNGPFTESAAIVSLEYAAETADALGRDRLRAERWRECAKELRANLLADGETYTMPDGKPLHYSVLGPIFPFRIDVDSARARASAVKLHEVLRSTRGWKPGFSDVFNGSNWMWAGAHLGIVHAMQENADLAWDAVRNAAASAGPFLSPNEHITAEDEIRVPWFTTGCGAWLYALNCLFVQVDEHGTRLLPAIPDTIPSARFRNLRAHGGVLISGEFNNGELVKLSARAPRGLSWEFRIPKRYAELIANDFGSGESGWIRAAIELQADVETSLLAAGYPSPPAPLPLVMGEGSFGEGCDFRPVKPPPY